MNNIIWNTLLQSNVPANTIYGAHWYSHWSVQEVRQKVKQEVLVIDNVCYILKDTKDIWKVPLWLEQIDIPYALEHLKSIGQTFNSSEDRFAKAFFKQMGKESKEEVYFSYLVHKILANLDNISSEVSKVYFCTKRGISIYKVSDNQYGSVYSKWKFLWLWDIQWISENSDFYLEKDNKVLHGYFNSNRRTQVNIHSYDDLLLKNKHSPQLAKHFEEVHNPITLYFIKEDLWFSMTDLTLEEQIKLVKFNSDESTDFFPLIKQAYWKYGKDFLDCFLWVCDDFSMWKFVLEYAANEQVQDIYKHFSSIKSTLESIIAEAHLLDVEIWRFKDTVYWKIKSAFNAFIDPEKSSSGINLDARYPLPTLIKKTFLSTLISQRWDDSSFLDVEKFNALSNVFRIDKFSWWELVWEETYKAMNSLENYKDLEKFWKAEYDMLACNIEKTYGEVDHDWSLVLKRAIPKDLKNKDVTFYFIKDIQENRPIACIKSKNLWENQLYVWSIYVDRTYTGEWCIGRYLINLMYDNNPEGTVYKWLVSAYAQSVEFHTLFATNYFEGITYDKDDQWQSEALFVIDSSAHNKWKFQSERFSKWKICPYVKDSSLCEFQEDIEYVVIDGSKENTKAYISFLEKGFSLWYSITRMFHEKDRWEINRKKTYIVFEKPSTS